VVEALTFHATLHGNEGVITFGEELVDYTRGRGVSFDPIKVPLPSFIDAQGELLPLDVRLTSGADLLAAMQARWQATDATLQGLLHLAGDSIAKAAIADQINTNNQTKSDWLDAVRPDFLTLHAQATATDIHARPAPTGPTRP
jgi:hypothetical protein